MTEGDEHPFWVWGIFQPESRAIFGAIRRCERAYWTAAEAREEVQTVADEMRIGRITWDQVDDRTFVGRTALDYIVAVSGVLPPLGQPPS
jgi:hypothetical protein